MDRTLLNSTPMARYYCDDGNYHNWRFVERTFLIEPARWVFLFYCTKCLKVVEREEQIDRSNQN